MLESENGVFTERLRIRRPTEGDRPRFVELFGDEDFMAFSNGVLSALEADARFDRMLARSSEISFAKQPIVERSSRMVIGYTGVDRTEFENQSWLEWGYRLATEARDKGYATEASAALLGVASREYTGEILAIIHPENRPSHGVIRKLGFSYWKRSPVHGQLRDLYCLEL
jgi:RimJ/RimL family protein N-acetyltransferase